MTDDEHTYFPGRRALADVELLLLGGYAPLAGFLGAEDAAAVRSSHRLADGTPWPVAPILHVPDDVAAASPVGSRLVLTDAEGAPVACLDVRECWQDPAAGSTPRWALAGPVTPGGPLERGPFRALRHSASQTRELLGDGPVLGVPVDGPLHRADVAGLRSQSVGERLLLVPLLDAEPGGLDPARLVRITQQVAKEVPNALVVPVPWARHAGDLAGEARLRAHVLAAYGATRASLSTPPLASSDDLPVPVVSPQPLGERLPDADVAELLARGAALPEGHTDPTVERELRAAYPPPHARGLTVLFTGLSGSGKSTVAHRLAELLAERTTRTVTLLDGDEVRRMLSAGLGFSRADRDMNVRRIGWVAAEISRHGGVALAAPIAPYAATRAEVRHMVEAVGEFVLVHVATPLEECERRDRKGLYAKARAGVIPEFTGISDPYEEPDDADMVLDTTDVEPDEAAAMVLTLLSRRGLVQLES